MTTYKEIKGTQIKVLASDPSNPVEGQVWYNSTDNVLKGHTLTGAGSWSTGGTLNTARWIYTHGAGTQTAGLVYGGESGPGAVTEAYNGTSWTEVNDLNQLRSAVAGVGADNTTALVFGGAAPGITAVTELWNGSNWTEVNDLNTARSNLAGSGSATAALAFAGSAPSNSALTESWSGTNWTETSDLNTARYFLAGSGTQTAAIAAGGQISSPTGATEEFTGAGSVTRTFTDS